MCELTVCNVWMGSSKLGWQPIAKCNRQRRSSLKRTSGFINRGVLRFKLRFPKRFCDLKMNMFSQPTYRLLFASIIATLIFSHTSISHGQRITYKEIDVERTINEPVTRTQWVEKKTLETDLETRQKQVIQTEKRQRTIITQKPVTETKYRIEKVTRQKPVTVQKFRERRTKQTTYKTINGVREETETVREPVIETEMRTERVTTKKPVTKELIEVQKTTTMKPVVKKETQFSTVPGQQLYGVLPDLSRRPRLRLLARGNYTDPTTGATVYRRGGLHWVQPNATVAAGQTPATTVPIEVESTTFEPEVVETRRPITVTRMVDETIERQVPVETKKFVERQVTRRVPYEYKVPVDKIVVEKIPYTETVYEEEVTERKVPYTETRMQEVRTIEDYDVQVPRYITETVRKEKPRTTWVEEEIQTTVQRTIVETMKVPFDSAGNPLSDPVPLNAPEYEFISQLPSVGTSTVRKPTLPRQSVYETQGQVADDPAGQRTDVRKPTSILVPETKPESAKMGSLRDTNSTMAPATTEPPIATKSSAAEIAPVLDSKAVSETSGTVRSLQAPEMPGSGISKATGNEKAAD